MCNLYQLTPKGDLERFFRTSSTEGADPRTAEPFGREIAPFATGAFVHAREGALVCTPGQWGMVAPHSRTRRPASRAVLTNNARVESIAERPSYRQAWSRGQRCLIPASWYQEPNWETGRNLWWRLKRRDGQPWALAGLWSEWVDPTSGEVLPNYTMITCNCDGHPLLARLHKPDPALPAHQQDKRAVIHLQPADWDAWLHGSTGQALQLIKPPPLEDFDTSDAARTDALLQSAQTPGAATAAASTAAAGTDPNAGSLGLDATPPHQRPLF